MRICHRKLPAPGFERVFNRTFRSRFLIHSSLLLKSSSHCILCSTSSKARQLPTRKSNPWSHERSFHALTSRPNSARNTYNEEFSHLPLKFHCNLSQFNRHLASLFRCRRMLELPVEVGCHRALVSSELNVILLPDVPGDKLHQVLVRRLVGCGGIGFLFAGQLKHSLYRKHPRAITVAFMVRNRARPKFPQSFTDKLEEYGLSVQSRPGRGPMWIVGIARHQQPGF